jgi:SAM-dependent methyltransferase
MSDTNYTGDDVLDVMSKYATNRNKSIEKLIALHLKFDKLNGPAKILEFGAGKGEFINRFIPRKNLELSAVEIDQTYLKDLSEKVTVYNSIDDVPSGLDCIYLIDVLEHLEEDKYFLSRFHDKLKKGGRIFIYVPARMELYSSFDKKIGHFRRYTLKELKSKVLEAGFEIELMRYHEILGYVASWLNKISGDSPDLNPSSVKIYDKILVPITNFVERIITAPIGKSIYLSAKKKM